MTDAERSKCLRRLRKTMKSAQTAGERVQATKLYFELMGAGTPSDTSEPRSGTGDIELPPIQREITEFDETARQSARQPWNEISSLLYLVQPPKWMAGLWSEVETGWLDRRTDTVMTYDEARVLIAARIAALNLSPDKVYAHPQSHSSFAEYFSFLNLPFTEQMERFK